jgi:hypothetical protein
MNADQIRVHLRKSAAISDSMEGLFCGKFARAYHGLQCKP